MIERTGLHGKKNTLKGRVEKRKEKKERSWKISKLEGAYPENGTKRIY